MRWKITLLAAVSVAVAAGLDVRQKGSRAWACCPLHGEKTPSLCFFPDGRWYCFGCHAHGDAADLYSVLYGVPAGQALRDVGGEPSRPSPGVLLRQRAEAWKRERWLDACRRKHAAKLPDELAAWAAAEDELNLLECATPAQVVRWMGRQT